MSRGLRLTPEKDATAWALRCEGHTYQQIASVIGCSPQSITVMLRRHRARISPPTVSRTRSPRFTDAEVSDILRRLGNGETQSSIAQSYGRHNSTISRICKADTYVHVPSPHVG